MVHEIISVKIWTATVRYMSSARSQNYFNEISKNSNLQKIRPAKYKRYLVFMYTLTFSNIGTLSQQSGLAQLAKSAPSNAHSVCIPEMEVNSKDPSRQWSK